MYDAQEFKDVLTVRTDSLKHHKERRQLFSAGPGADAEAALPLLRSQQQWHSSSTAAGDPASASSSQAAALQQQSQQQQFQPPVPSFLQQQQQQLTLSAPQDTYMSSRAEALHNVESTIVELGGIFNKLSEMVSQQVRVCACVGACVHLWVRMCGCMGVAGRRLGHPAGEGVAASRVYVCVLICAPTWDRVTAMMVSGWVDGAAQHFQQKVFRRQRRSMFVLVSPSYETTCSYWCLCELCS
eukprot:1159677-Pelagomonas_calceolata.AAC.2